MMPCVYTISFNPRIFYERNRDVDVLLDAVSSGNIDKTTALLERGVRQGPQCYRDGTILTYPLHTACRHLFKSTENVNVKNYREIVKVLVENDPDALRWTISSTCPNDGYVDREMKPTTPIHYAIQYTDAQDPESLKFLNWFISKHPDLDDRAKAMLRNRGIHYDHPGEEIPEAFRRNSAMWQPDLSRIYTIQDVGSFRLLGRIGQGCFGTVFKAQEVSTGIFRAIKLLHSPRDKEDRIHAHIMKHGGHDHVIRSFGSGQMFGKTWIVMELIEGNPLDLFGGTVDDNMQAQYKSANAWLSNIGVMASRENEGENILVRTDELGNRHIVLIDFGTDTDYPVRLLVS